MFLLLALAFVHSSENVTRLHVERGSILVAHAGHGSLGSLFKHALLSREVVGLEGGCFLHGVALDGFAFGRFGQFSNSDLVLFLCIRHYDVA